MVCLDTDFIIDYLKEQHTGKKGSAVGKFEELIKRGESPKTTMINVSELYRGAYYFSTDHRVRELDVILSEFEILPLTFEAAKLSGSLAAYLKQSGTMIGISDILIASIVLEENDTLITRNVKHFSKIPELTLETY